MHRFGSHVLQTLLSISKGTILREVSTPPSSSDKSLTRHRKMVFNLPH